MPVLFATIQTLGGTFTTGGRKTTSNCSCCELQNSCSFGHLLCFSRGSACSILLLRATKAKHAGMWVDLVKVIFPLLLSSRWRCQTEPERTNYAAYVNVTVVSPRCDNPSAQSSDLDLTFVPTWSLIIWSVLFPLVGGSPAGEVAFSGEELSVS